MHYVTWLGLWLKVKCLNREESSAACIWVRPELVAEVKFLTWTDDNLLRQVVYEGLREDKPTAEVRRPVPYPKADGATAATKK